MSTSEANLIHEDDYDDDRSICQEKYDDDLKIRVWGFYAEGASHPHLRYLSWRTT